MILIRYILIGFIIYLLVRSFMKFGEEAGTSIPKSEPEKKDKITIKKISKEVGEYVDYEEVGKKKP